ncbi:PhnA domain-containing protein [Fluviicola taffensis]|uniref:PhnA protein n=1 Tax=Fluviicola taffensis (strain DSM 16823 / NCIMB 13979 / RW262) TaxID=755732 RepID=F2IGF0_FLUTR|nr:alkylphosphonate utilization protein [Fluviicola taffensis]AEA45816.1 PhnA protein [Fluviicola taffensis DSM 16823]
MNFEKQVISRSGNVCELSGATEDLQIYQVQPSEGNSADDFILISQNLKNQLEGSVEVSANDWRCLNDSMWSEVSAVKVVAYRMLDQLKGEGWPNDLLEMIYLDEAELTWAKAGMEDEDAIKHIDSNGVVLKAGDTVVLIKELDVKGSTITAKRGTAVRNIKLVHDDPTLIEGKVDGQSIYILTQFVKK